VQVQDSHEIGLVKCCELGVVLGVQELVFPFGMVIHFDVVGVGGLEDACNVPVVEIIGVLILENLCFILLDKGDDAQTGW
jgi:hypothetical protein